MAKEFFKNFPEMQYKLDSGKLITIKDFFRKATVDASARDSVIEYTYHELEEGDRPDVLASKLYGNGDLHWTFFLVNELNNYYDWWKDQSTFQKYIEKKLRGHFLIAENSTDIVNATKKLKPGGKILVITFHSIEDKIVKYYFNNFSKNKSRPSRYLPEKKIEQAHLFEEYKNKVLKPSKKEVEINNRARSAKLRFATRSNTDFQYPYELIDKFKNYLELESANV